MDKGLKLRMLVHKILFDIYRSKTNIDYLFKKYSIEKYDLRDIAFINTVCLNTMRYSFHTKGIISQFTKTKPKLKAQILLSSAITQIVYLDFKNYAVLNDSVEIAKKNKIYHSFINAFLRKICSNKEKLKRTKIVYSDLPKWFNNETIDLNIFEKNQFLNNFYKEPDIHLVFKNSSSLLKFKDKIVLSSHNSGFLVNKKKIENLSSYNNGSWWVQDFSSSFPLNNISDKLIEKKCLDVCGAPGGKSFQILARQKNVVINDKSKKRLEILKKNLHRLNFKAEITNLDYKKLNSDKKYDFIIVDAPCSAIGTIRKNPEIFFRKSEPDFENLVELQTDMLQKTSELINDKGVILYMVCSFLKIETIDQISKFLKKNNNFFLYTFDIINNDTKQINFIKKNYMRTVPSSINSFNIDGYFAAYLKKKF